jgi:hypothetical protein
MLCSRSRLSHSAVIVAADRLLAATKVISQNEDPDSIYAGRANQNVPFRQKRIAF